MSSSQIEDRNSGSGSRSLISQPSAEQPPPDRSARIDSFENYPLPHYVNVLQLAKYGFIFRSNAEYPQSVYCVGCGKAVNSWKQGDEPFRQEFHQTECMFVRAQTPSEDSGSIKDMSENLIRASVNSNEESTKPLETATTSGAEFENPSISQLPQRGMQSYIPTNPNQKLPPARQAFSLPPPEAQAYNVSPRTEFSLTRMRSREEGGSRTSEVELIRARHHHATSRFGHRSYSPAPSSMFGQSSIAPSSLQPPSSGFSNITYPPQNHHHHSYGSQPQSEFEGQSLQPRSNLEDIIDTLEMRVAENRLRTFELSWSEQNEFRNYRLLVVCGFYSLGQGDAVECFCCHVIIANWTRNDNPRTRHIAMSPVCRFMADEKCGDVPLQLERRNPVVVSPSRGMPPSLRSRRHSSPHTSHLSPFSSRISSPYTSHHSLLTSHHSSAGTSHHSSPHQSLIAQPSVEGAVGPAPTAHPSLQGSSGQLAETYSRPTPAIFERSNLMTGFPCLNPANPAMRENHARLQTFTNQEFRRRTRLQSSNEILAQAGFYYIGVFDRVKCWFCDGGLRYFQPGDDPWVEHAKYFPQCEYLLQQRGPAWVNIISEQNPNVERPIFPRRESRILPQVVSSPTPLPPPPPRIENPDQLEQYKNQLLEEGMQSEPAQRAREMGYSEDRIRNAQWQKILLDDCCYQSAETLINVLTPDNQPDSSSASASVQSPVLEMPNQNIHFQGNVYGPSVINGQFFPPTSNGNNFHYSSTTGTELFINGQPMNEFMSNAFDHPFFRGEMNHFLQGSTTVIHSHRPPAPVINHHTLRPRGPAAPPRPAAPTVPPPPRPPLQAITIPRRRAPGTASTASIPTTSTNTSASSSGEASASSARERLEALERERICKICLNAQSDILFQPCGHICSCENCARMVRSCPVCRAPIASYIRTYHA